MKNDELTYYNKIKNWDFSMIKFEEENLTNWDMYKILNDYTNENSIILDLGTGGGEKVLKEFPKARKIIGTDFSEEMIKTANQNLKESGKTNIEFKVMDNLNMDMPDNYFDIVVARHTCISADQIFKTLKNNGKLILRGVDKLDCWQLKRKFNKGQAFNDIKPISQIDYENILDAGFKNVELVPIYIREYYKTKEDLLALLLKTPILDDFSEERTNDGLVKNEIDFERLEQYIKENTYEKGILLRRMYYGIVADKP
jgi:precorrin-6B methylase 2